MEANKEERRKERRVLHGKKFCDGHRDCDDAILNWLNAESDDDTVVEHTEGQTINISHANVVIID